jgi:hypothetical protein
MFLFGFGVPFQLVGARPDSPDDPAPVLLLVWAALPVAVLGAFAVWAVLRQVRGPAPADSSPGTLKTHAAPTGIVLATAIIAAVALGLTREGMSSLLRAGVAVPWALAAAGVAWGLLAGAFALVALGLRRALLPRNGFFEVFWATAVGAVLLLVITYGGFGVASRLWHVLRGAEG